MSALPADRPFVETQHAPAAPEEREVDAIAATNPAVEQHASTRWVHAFLPFKVAEGAVGPALPLLAAALGATAALIGVMEFAFSAAAILGAFVWGRTSDETRKRKPFIVTGFFLASAALVGLAIASGVTALILLRALMGFSVAAFVTVGGALMADQSRRQEVGARLGRMNAVGGLGYTIGLALAATLLARWAGMGLGALFLGAGIVAFGSVVLAALWIREPDFILRRREIHRVFRNVAVPFVMPVQRRTFSPTLLFHRPKWSELERRAWAYLFAMFLLFLATGSVVVLLPLYLLGLGASPSTVFVIFIVHALVSTLAFAPAGRLADRIGYRKVQLASMGARASAFSLLLVPVLASPVGVAVALALVGATFAVLATTGPAALLRGMAIRERGELNGLYNIASGAGLALGGLLAGGVVHVAGFPQLFGLAVALTLAATAVTAAAVYPPASRGRPPALLA